MAAEVRSIAWVLTLWIVVDHDRAGAALRAGEGRNAAALTQFYELPGQQRCQRIEAVSMDIAGAYARAMRHHGPRPPLFPAENEIRIALSAVTGEVGVAGADRREKVTYSRLAGGKRNSWKVARPHLFLGIPVRRVARSSWTLIRHKNPLSTQPALPNMGDGRIQWFTST